MKQFSIVLIILMLIAFISTTFYTKNTVKVSEVVTPALVSLDLNKNGRTEANERFVVEGIDTFTSSVSDYQKVMAENLGIDEDTALAIGYFAEKYAQSLIEDRQVKYKKLDNGNIVITFNGKNYNQIIKKSPFALIDGKPVNKKDFDKQIQLAKNSQLRIYNNKSNKYHKLSCKYGQMAHDSLILPKNQLPKNAQACNFCKDKHTSNESNKQSNEIVKEKELIKNIHPKSFSISKENIKLFLTDLTTVLYPSGKCTSDFCKELVIQINNSNKSIDMALYGYTNIPDITFAIERAIKRGVQVRMVYDVNNKGLNFYPDTFNMARMIVGSKGDYGESDYQNSIMHNKFFIFDKKIVLTGSANISSSDVCGFNSNAIILIKSPEIAEIYEQEFNQMAENNFHNKKLKLEHKENILLGDSIISVYFSPKDRTIDNILIPLINNAKKYIYIPTFIITHKPVTQALIDAKTRGVDIKIIIDATSANNKYSTHQQLRDNKILVKTENYAGKMHAKSLIIDDKYVIVGSMNLSKNGNSKNDENILVIENPNLAKYYKDFFVYQWGKISDKWLTKNASSESHDSLGSCFDGIDNDFDGKIDTEDSGCKYVLQKSKSSK
ncbi:MAG: phosphatidylserine/phosphatidylglycerophosphate/cardiolipin synthase family protein [Candidatus Gastranaerophilaceae bacterium]